MSSLTNALAKRSSEPKISASAAGRALGVMVLTIVGGWAGLGYYKLQADVRVLNLDSRITVLERKVDQVHQTLNEIRRELQEREGQQADKHTRTTRKRKD